MHDTLPPGSDSPLTFRTGFPQTTPRQTHKTPRTPGEHTRRPEPSTNCALDGHGWESELRRQLSAVEIGVQATLVQERVVIAPLDNAPVLNHEDLVSGPHRREPVGNDQ